MHGYHILYYILLHICNRIYTIQCKLYVVRGDCTFYNMHLLRLTYLWSMTHYVNNNSGLHLIISCLLSVYF